MSIQSGNPARHDANAPDFSSFDIDSKESKRRHLDGAGDSPETTEDGSRDGDFLSAGRSRSLTCSYPGCAVQTVFTRKSDLKKHMDRHTRPYRCDRVGCEAPPFGDIGGLFRHQREVHKSREGDRPFTEHFCPDASCERHNRGFPRRWNLLEHQRRIHGISRDDPDERKSPARSRHARRPSRAGGPPSSRPMSPTSPSSPASDSHDSYARSPTAGQQHLQNAHSLALILEAQDGRNGAHGHGGSSISAASNSSNTARDLQHKLLQLEDRRNRVENERSKLDQDIDAIKHTLRVFEDGGI